MSDNTNLPGIISSVAAGCALLWAFFVRFFSTVTRKELRETLEVMRQERRDMHIENRETLARIHERVDDLWKRVP